MPKKKISMPTRILRRVENFNNVMLVTFRHHIPCDADTEGLELMTCYDSTLPVRDSQDYNTPYDEVTVWLYKETRYG